MLSREEFETEIAPLRAALEQRRQNYLRYLYAGIAVAGLILGAAMFFPEKVLLGIERLFHMGKPIAPSDIFAFRLFAVFCVFLLPLGPILSYRGTHGFSIEGAIYDRLLGLFGALMPMKAGGITGADIRRTGLFATPLLFRPEEGAAGVMNDVRVRFCNAAFYTRTEEQDTLVFRGLLILCEPANRIDEVTLNQATAAALAPPLRGLLSQLAINARAVPPAKAYWDEKLIYGAGALYVRLQEAIFARIGKNELPAEKSYRLKYAITPQFTRACRPEADNALCEPYAFEYSYEASLTAIASHGILFTLGSLFAPAFDNVRADYLYEAMQGVDAVTRHFSESTRV